MKREKRVRKEEEGFLFYFIERKLEFSKFKLRLYIFLLIPNVYCAPFKYM